LLRCVGPDCGRTTKSSHSGGHEPGAYVPRRAWVR
jgi:hypothetical protein